MKKFVSMLMAAILLLSMIPAATADTVIDPKEDRKIEIQQAGLNETAEGVSPTTGLTLADLETPEGFAGLAVTGRYMPMLVQIDNFNGGIGYRAPWGVSYVDVVYETPLERSGATRLSFLFSDLIPDSVGPVRSARIGHVWLREEWDAGFLYFGQQEHHKADAKEELRQLGAVKKGLAFTGMAGAWVEKGYYNRRKGLQPPHNVDANAAGMYAMIDPELVAPNHAFRFTDAMPEGDAADEIRIDTGKAGYGSNLIYDVDSNLYFRYMRSGKGNLTAYEDFDTNEHIGFANVIVQFAEVEWGGSQIPITYHVGEYYKTGKGEKSIGGNADFFMGGVHMKGYWNRADMESRTVFYTEDGQEVELQRGKTLVVIVDSERWEVSYKAY